MIYGTGALAQVKHLGGIRMNTGTSGRRAVTRATAWRTTDHGHWALTYRNEMAKSWQASAPPPPPPPSPSTLGTRCKEVYKKYERWRMQNARLWVCRVPTFNAIQTRLLYAAVRIVEEWAFLLVRRKSRERAHPVFIMVEIGPSRYVNSRPKNPLLNTNTLFT